MPTDTPRAPVVVLVVAFLGWTAATVLGPTGARLVSSPRAVLSAAGQTEISLIIGADPGAPARYAVPDFLALSDDEATARTARAVAGVLWDDLAFEREFYLIPRDVYGTVPVADRPDDVPFTEWRELGADAVVIGTVARTGDTVRVQVWLYDVRSQGSVFAREYSGPVGNVRLYAHQIADDIHEQQRGLRGVARTKLTFSSDRDGERVDGTVEDRTVKEIYISDYDGANQQRLTRDGSLNSFPVWLPDARGILYTSWVRGYRELFLVRIYEGTRQEPTEAHAADRFGFRPQSALGVVSPDGTRIVFESSRDGNSELYLMDVDGSNLFRLTNHPAADITPTWSPQGSQIAFTSDRRGRPQIYTMAVDGTNLTALTFEDEADRATWSPLGTEIAFTARTDGKNDIKVIDLGTRDVRQITHERSNESPTFSPNGRHLAFMSNRTGRMQIYTIARDGQDLRQITTDGENFTPNWSN